MAGHSNGNGQSLSELERQTETRRSELGHTVEEVQNRVTPRALKQDAKDYARTAGQQILQSKTRTRDNPMAANAVAAGVAVPLWRLISGLPAPLLLIGAGLAMSQRGNGTVGRGTWNARTDFSGQTNPHEEEVENSLKVSVSEIETRVSNAVGDTLDNARRMAHDAVDGTRSMAEDAASSIKDSAAEAARMANETMQRSRSTMTEMIERHPLVVGGAALLVGGLIASALPVTRQEDRLLGKMSDDLKSRGRDIAEKGFEATKAAASDVYDDVAAQTREHGLIPETIRGATRQAIDKAETVMGKAAAAVDDSRSRAGRQRRG